ncbi:MAG: ketol-acid reductoisomerase [Candidatus Zixiibacteriota bacterium]
MKKRIPFRIYKDDQANLKFLQDKTISIIGYGNQGMAQAQNLRDSGFKIIIGLPKGNKDVKLALKDGFEVYSNEEATRLGDVISILAPDHLHKEIYLRQIEPYLLPGKTLVFACGFSVHFQLVVPPDFVDVILVAPHAPGRVMRELFIDGKGVPAFIAVNQDNQGKAKKTALAYAQAIGCTRAGVFETTFKDEAIGDLFGEQVVLCGGLSELLRTGFDVLVESGLPPENAYLECIHQLDYIVNIIKSDGIAGMFDRISKTAEFGSYISGRRIISEKTKTEMKKILREIQDGKFSKTWMKEYEEGMKNYSKFKKQVTNHPVERISKRIRSLSK